MSEYQYYEFRAVDRPLSRTEQGELRAISSRAQINASGFVNHYEWGDLKGDPDRLMERYFDLFLYLANWGTRRLSMRLPRRLVDAAGLKRFVISNEIATIRTAGENLIVDVVRDEIEIEDWNDGGGRLEALSALRENILDGDLRLFYLVWLMALESDEAPDDALEPMAGLGPLTQSLKAFAQFFCIDGDLVAAAVAGDTPVHSVVEPPRPAVARVIDNLDEREKAAYLLRLYDGDPHLRAELRRRCRVPTSRVEDRQARRTAGELRATAHRLAEERRRAEAERQQVAERKQRQKEEKAKSIRLDALAERGEAAWRNVENLIALRNNPSYNKAVALLSDLRDLALRQGTDDELHHRLREIRTRHRTKPRLIERLTAASLD